MTKALVMDIADSAMEISAMNSIVRQVPEHGPAVQNNVKQKLKEERLDEEESVRIML
jgi:hypothetical protein